MTIINICGRFKSEYPLTSSCKIMHAEKQRIILFIITHSRLSPRLTALGQGKGLSKTQERLKSSALLCLTAEIDTKMTVASPP